MDESRLKQVEERLDSIESRLSTVENRLRRLTEVEAPPPAARHGYAPPPPPPVVAAPPIIRQRPAYDIPRPSAPPSAPPADSLKQEPVAAFDLEAFIGNKLMKYVAALLILLSIVYFVIWGYQQGRIGNREIFASEVIFCFGFIAFGVLKRNLAGDFGQVVAGIGSCGLYISLVDGHQYRHLYGGEILVGLFMALSIANLGYSLWRSSRAFLAIGLLGGLAGALLPLREHHPLLNIYLHFLILVPSALIVAKRKWLGVSPILWIVSSLALVPLLSSEVAWPAKILAICASTLLCVAVHSFCFEKSEFDPHGSFVPFAVFATGLIAFFIRQDPQAALYLVGFGALCSVLALAFKADSLSRSRLILGGALVAMVLAPFCLSPEAALLSLICLSAACAAASFKFVPKWAATFGGLELGLALFAYLGSLTFHTFAWRTEIALVVGIMAATGLVTTSFVRARGNAQAFVVASLGLLVPLFVQLVSVGFTRSEIQMPIPLAIAFALVAASYMVTGLAMATKWRLASISVWVTLSLALCSYVWLLEESPISHAVDVGVASAIFLSICGAAYIAVSGFEKDAKVAVQTMAVLGAGGLLTRILQIGLLESTIAIAPGPAVVLAATSCAAIGVGTAFFKRWIPAIVAGWCLLAFAIFEYYQLSAGSLPLASNGLNSMLEFQLLAFILAVFTAGTYMAVRMSTEKKVIRLVAGLAAWPLFTGCLVSGFEAFHVGIHTGPAITIAWTLYGVVLLTIGFLFKAAQYRYVSLGVFGIAVAKVLLVDLSQTDAAVRVGVLLGLGLTLLAGGYAYVKVRHVSA